MKTEMALLLMTDGCPIMSLAEICKMLGIAERTAEQKIYAKTFPVLAFKAGSKWVVNVHDVAAYLDEQRAAALREAQSAL